MGILEEIVRAPQLAGSEIESRAYSQDKPAGPAEAVAGLWVRTEFSPKNAHTHWF
jgi:hypothetical protein